MAVRTQAGSLIDGQASPYILVPILQIILIAICSSPRNGLNDETTEFSVEPLGVPPLFAKTREFDPKHDHVIGSFTLR